MRENDQTDRFALPFQREDTESELSESSAQDHLELTDKKVQQIPKSLAATIHVHAILCILKPLSFCRITSTRFQGKINSQNQLLFMSFSRQLI